METDNPHHFHSNDIELASELVPDRTTYLNVMRHKLGILLVSLTQSSDQGLAITHEDIALYIKKSYMVPNPFQLGCSRGLVLHIKDVFDIAPLYTIAAPLQNFTVELLHRGVGATYKCVWQECSL